MREEKSFKITELVDQLIGSVSFNGDSYYDAISLDNLDNLEDVVIELVIKLSKLCELKDDYRGSAQLLAKKALVIVDNILCNLYDVGETKYYKVIEK